MQFVNISNRPVYTVFTGSLGAGKVSSGNGDGSRQLERLLEKIVSACKDSLGIRLSDKEANLLNKLMELDERGGGFDPASIPPPKPAKDISIEAQKRRLEAVAEANDAAARREAEINGEVLNKPERKPVGPATLADEGVKVEPEMLKTGFDAIMEANAEIEKSHLNPKEALDPIGAHAAGTYRGVTLGEHPESFKEKEPAEPSKAIGKDPEPVPEASNREDDATRSADTSLPEPEPAGNGKMDQQAAEMAKKLSTIGPEPGTSEGPEEELEAPKAKRGRGRRAR